MTAAPTASGLADAFQAQAEKKGIKILGRDRLDPKAADYTAVLTKIKSLNPEALYYGGVLQAGVKLAKQAYDIMPKVIKAGGDGMYGPRNADRASGFPANEGWYATIASPHLTERREGGGLGEGVSRRSSTLSPTTTRSPPMTPRW